MTPLEQVLRLVAQLSPQERGRLRHLLAQAGSYSVGDPSKVGTNVVQGK